MKKIFIPRKKYFPKKSGEKADRPFQLSWWKIFSWLCYSLIENEAYCMYCVLFNSDSSGSDWKIQLVRTPFKAWSDAQCCFKRQSESKTGVNSKAMYKYKGFLKHVFRKKCPVDQQLNKSTVKQDDKNRLSLIDPVTFQWYIHLTY